MSKESDGSGNGDEPFGGSAGSFLPIVVEFIVFFIALSFFVLALGEEQSTTMVAITSIFAGATALVLGVHTWRYLGRHSAIAAWNVAQYRKRDEKRRTVVRSFFEALAAGNWKTAHGLLSPSLQSNTDEAEMDTFLDGRDLGEDLEFSLPVIHRFEGASEVVGSMTSAEESITVSVHLTEGDDQYRITGIELGGSEILKEK